MECGESKYHMKEERVFECSLRYDSSVDFMGFRISSKCLGGNGCVVMQKAQLKKVESRRVIDWCDRHLWYGWFEHPSFC